MRCDGLMKRVFITNCRKAQKPCLLPKDVDCTKQRDISPDHLREATSSIFPCASEESMFVCVYSFFLAIYEALCGLKCEQKWRNSSGVPYSNCTLRHVSVSQQLLPAVNQLPVQWPYTVKWAGHFPETHLVFSNGRALLFKNSGEKGYTVMRMMHHDITSARGLYAGTCAVHRRLLIFSKCDCASDFIIV